MKAIIQIGNENKLKDVTIGTLKKTLKEAWENDYATRVEIYKKTYGFQTKVADISMLHPLKIELRRTQLTNKEIKVYMNFAIELLDQENCAFDITWKENEEKQ